MANSNIIICPSCAGLNKVPDSRLTDGGKCGKCHSPLLTGDVISANQQLFQKYIGKSSLPIIVDFWASWCGPCKMMAPIFTQVAKKFQYKAYFLKVSTETEQQLAAQYNIRSIPTLAVFKQGKEVSRQAGAMDANSLQQWVASQLN
jgi:thioredoxin 2